MVDWRQASSQNIQQLIQQVQSLPMASPEWQHAIDDLADELLKRRPIFRRRNRLLSPFVSEILTDTREQLVETLKQGGIPFPRASSELTEWSAHQLEMALRSVLTGSTLEQLALEAQKNQPRTAAWQQGLTDLIRALKLSNQLIRPSSLSQEDWEDSVNQTFAWVAANLLAFDVTRGRFISWVNFRLRMIAKTLPSEKHDPLNRQLYGRTIRTQYQLRQLLNKMPLSSILHLGEEKLSLSMTWIWLYLKGALPDKEATWSMLLRLMILTELAVVLQQVESNSHQFLFETAQSLLALPVGVVSTSMDIVLELTAPDEAVDLSEAVYDCVKVDPCGIYKQSHVKGYPNATFQEIFLGRWKNESWQSLSNRLGPPMSTLSTFFYRKLVKFAPQIRRCAEDEE